MLQGSRKRLMAPVGFAHHYAGTQLPFRMIVRRRYPLDTQKRKPLLQVFSHVLGQFAKFIIFIGLTKGEPTLQHRLTVPSLLRKVGFTIVRATLRETDRVFDNLDQSGQMRGQLFVGCFGDHLLDPTQEMGIALPLRIFEHIVAVQSIDDEDTVKRWAENLRGNVAAATVADGVNRHVFRGEHPQPGVDAANAPTGLVGMHDLTLPQGVQQQRKRWLGLFEQTILRLENGRRIDINAKIGFEKLRDIIIGHTKIVFHFGGHCQYDGANLVAGGAESIRSLQGMAGMMSTFATRTKTGLDFELPFNRRDDNIGLKLGVSLQITKGSAAIGARGNGNRDNLVDSLGFGPVGRGMVVGPAWRFGRSVLELIIAFAKRVRRAFLVTLLLGTLFSEAIAFGTKLLDVEFEFGDFFDEQGALRTGGNSHGNSSEQPEVRCWLKLIKGCVSRCVQSSANE